MWRRGLASLERESVGWARASSSVRGGSALRVPSCGIRSFAQVAAEAKSATKSGAKSPAKVESKVESKVEETAAVDASALKPRATAVFKTTAAQAKVENEELVLLTPAVPRGGSEGGDVEGESVSVLKLAQWLSDEKTREGLRLIDVRLPAELNGDPSIPNSLSFPIKKRVQEQLDAQTTEVERLQRAQRAKRAKKGVALPFPNVTAPETDAWGTAIAMGPARFASRIGFEIPPKDKIVVFYGSGSTRAAATAASARARGFKALHLVGGTRLWNKFELSEMLQAQQAAAASEKPAAEEKL